MSYDHIVEAILDDLPQYIKDQYPLVVELLRDYYKQDANGLMEALWGHDARLDIDANGIAPHTASFAYKRVLDKNIREFFAASTDYLQAQGTPRGVEAYGKYFHAASIRVDPTYKYVLEPSSARTNRYQRCFIQTNKAVEGVIFQGGVGADVVSCSCVAETIYEVIYSPRHPSWLMKGSAVVEPEGRDIQVLQEDTLVGAAGNHYMPGQTFSIADAIGEVTIVLNTTKTISPREVMLANGGQGFKVGDIISAKGSHASLVVREVGPLGEVVTFAVFEDAPIAGQPVWQYVERASGLVITSPWGRPAGISSPRPLVGITAHPPIFEVVAKYSRHDVVETPNGIIGIGSTITDSELYQYGSYIARGNASVGEWSRDFLDSHHPSGRCVEMRQLVECEMTVAPSITTSMRPFASINQSISTGESSTGEL